MRIEAGRFKGRTLPRAEGARPAGARLRRSLFSALGGRLEGARVLDLFAGAGALGLEALSRGAREVVLVERDPRAAGRLARWVTEAGAGAEASVLRRDAARGALPEGPFDLVFLDPPFAAWGRPDAAALVARAVAVLAPEGWLVLKAPARRPLPEDPRWLRLRSRTVGDAAWVVLAPPGPASRPAPAAPMEEGAERGPLPPASA